MNFIDRLDQAVDAISKKRQQSSNKNNLVPAGAKKVSDRTLSYSERYRGQWFRPEYDFDELQIAQDNDSYLFRAIKKKVDRVICAGVDLTGSSEDSLRYVENRLKIMSWGARRPWKMLLWDTFADVGRFSNCIWAKKRSIALSPGKMRTDIDGIELQPVAGYFVIPMETVEFKTKRNGEIKKVMQRLPSGQTKEFSPRDIVHFYMNRKPGFAVGTPEMYPALDDIALLRRIEENIEDLIESNLFPVFHYKVGNDSFPERRGPDGIKESDIVKQTISYMPAGGIYVSDHRHEIKAIGSEGRALRIDYYINHFKSRIFAAMGTTAVDMGEGASANRSTANTLSKNMIMDVEAMICVVKEFFEFYIISELLLEGGYNPMDPDQMVYLKFGVIDKDDRRAEENQQIQMFHANLRDMDEVRKSLGDRPFTDANMERTYQKMFAEPLALSSGLGPDNAASHALAAAGASNITSQGVSKEVKHVEKQAKAAAKAAPSSVSAKVKKNSTTSTSANKAKPSNQHGTRSSAKTNSDVRISDSNGNIYTISCDRELNLDTLAEWNKLVCDRHSELGSGTEFKTLAHTMLWRLHKES